MKTNEVLIGLAVAAGAYYVYKQYTLGSGLQFVPLAVTPGGNGLLVTVGVQNPSSSAATLNSFAGNLTANNSAIASVSNFQGMTIQPNAQTQLQFSVTPNLIGLGMNILDLAENGVGDLKFGLSGTANVNNTPIPVNINF